ncbi:Cuticle 3 domain containing protein, partial [Asbolus verrucosus]
ACANAGYLGAPVASYASYAPALSYSAAAPALGSTFHGSYAAPAVAYSAPALAAPAITSQHSNIIRSFGNLGQVSTYSKSIDTPFSSVRKADIRVSNPGVRIAAAAPALAYSAPAISTYHGGYAAPAIAAPVLRTAVAAPVLRTAVAAPALSAYAAPAVGYAGLGHAVAAPALGYAGLGHAVAAPAALGVAYSAAPAVSHINYASA